MNVSKIPVKTMEPVGTPTGLITVNVITAGRDLCVLTVGTLCTLLVHANMNSLLCHRKHNLTLLI